MKISYVDKLSKNIREELTHVKLHFHENATLCNIKCPSVFPRQCFIPPICVYCAVRNAINMAETKEYYLK